MKYFLFFLCISRVFSFEESISSSESFAFFHSKPVAILWRGVHFSPSVFQTEKLVNDHLLYHGIQMPIYCSAAYKNSGVTLFERLGNEKTGLLERECVRLYDVFNQMSNLNDFKLNDKNFFSARDAFQQSYTNSTDFIHHIGNNPQKKYEILLQDLPQGNPLLSFSSMIKHSAFYGYGLKDYGPSNPLILSYDNRGCPNVTYLGYIQCVLLTDQDSKKAHAYNVVLHHEAGNIKVKTYSSCNILSEHEVSLVAKVPGKNVVMRIKLKAPDFSQPYDHTVTIKTGLTKRKYNNARDIIFDEQISDEEKEKKVKSVLKSMTEGVQTNDLAHNYTLTYKYANSIQDIMEKEGYEFIPGAVNLDGGVSVVQ
ncbi:MAG: hypothetical protein Q8R43_02370 [Alphaproteobacteria bacterium]|nr:hypothetical protein [Alphaproteobacteria bacterium]